MDTNPPTQLELIFVIFCRRMFFAPIKPYKDILCVRRIKVAPFPPSFLFLAALGWQAATGCSWHT
jgi:hypothetical protein